MKKRLAIVLAAGLLAAAALVQAGSAARGVQLAPTGKAIWPDREIVVSLPSAQRIQSSRFTVRENGKPVLGPSILPATGSVGTILVIDASNSMRGAPITGALTAIFGIVMGRMRAATEEAEMLEQFGDRYARYLQETECFIPGIW